MSDPAQAPAPALAPAPTPPSTPVIPAVITTFDYLERLIKHLYPPPESPDHHINVGRTQTGTFRASIIFHKHDELVFKVKPQEADSRDEALLKVVDELERAGQKQIAKVEMLEAAKEEKAREEKENRKEKERERQVNQEQGEDVAMIDVRVREGAAG